MLKETKSSGKATFFDRFAVGFLAALLAFLTCGFLWLVFGRNSTGSMFPVEVIWVSTGIMFIIGFLTLDKYFINILAPIWHFIVRFVG